MDVPTKIAHSTPAVGKRRNQHILLHIHDATKAVNVRKERGVNRGAANEAAAMQNKYYNKGDTCFSFSFCVPLNDCVNDVSDLRYPRGRVGVENNIYIYKQL